MSFKKRLLVSINIKPVALNLAVLLCLGAFQLIIAPNISDAATPSSSFETIVQFADELMLDTIASEDLVGVSVALVYKKNQLWSKGYGVASRRNNIAFNGEANNSLYELAKLFTASW